MVIVLPFRTPQPAASLRLREVVKDGEGELTRWFALNRGSRAKFRIRVQHLQKTSRTEWNKKQFKYLRDGLAEIKWKCSDKEFRAVGFDFKGFFVMLLGCTHKQGVYDPHNWLNTAKKLKGEVENEQWHTAAFEP